MEEVGEQSCSKTIKPRKNLTFNEKNMVQTVFTALEKDHPMKTKDDLVKKCSKYTGVGKSTVYKVLKEKATHGRVQKPKKAPGKARIIIDDDIKNALRRKIHTFFFNKEYPTLKKIRLAIEEDSDIPKMKQTKLWEALKEINFMYAKVDRKSMLIEREEIIAWRRNYIRMVRRARDEGKQIFYLDETWLNEGYSVSKVWQDKNIKSSRQAFMEGWSTGLKIPSGKGRRLIILHIGNEHGFVDNGLLTFESKKTGDYHEDMNAAVFEEWFEKILNKLQPGSVIVMDNASYHSRRTEQLPTTAWRKQQIKDWLIERNIEYDESFLKAELLTLARQHFPYFKKYVVDEMAKAWGMEVLRLPPYHCELNPIELIWAQIKGKVARENTTFKLADVKKLLEAAINEIKADNWTKCINHVKKVESKMWDLDIMMDTPIQPLTININEESSESENDFSSGSEQ